MKQRSKFSKALTAVISCFLVCLAFVCICVRVPQFSGAEAGAVLAAAAFTMPDGKYKLVNNPASNDSAEKTTAPETTENNSAESENSDTTAATEATAETKSREGVKKYEIIETQYGAGGSQYKNFFVKNRTNYTLNIEELLQQPLGFKMDDSRQVQVLIVHTHTSESYMDEDNGFFYEDFYPRTTDNNKNITQVGQRIAQSLKEAGIGVVHATTSHDHPSYNGSYDRSYNTTMEYLEKYPNIKVILDIHRDSISSESGGKVKPTFTYNNKKAAQIMIMAGYDEDGSYDYPDWNYNLRFALRLQQQAESMYPGMTRPLYFGDFVYNMNVNTGSLLIEIGTDANTLDEAKYTGELLGNALAEVLQTE